jgi:hypothetical protein
MMEVEIAKMDPNESVEMRLFNNQRLSLTKSRHVSGVISKMNSCDIEQLSDVGLESILLHSVETIDLQLCSINSSDLILRCHLLYVCLPEGPIGLDLLPCHEGGAGCGCGGLRVVKIFNQSIMTMFQTGDVIIAINKINIKDLEAGRAVELLQTTANRILTIVRSEAETVHCPEGSVLKDYFHSQTPQSILRSRSHAKKYLPSLASLPSYRSYICDVEKRFSSRPSFAFIPSLDSNK